ncbi:hypothetical protein [Pseudomonas sp. L5B5]|nr:hypothetical protein [Pseudomonas sp. L5B5]
MYQIKDDAHFQHSGPDTPLPWLLITALTSCLRLSRRDGDR